MNKILGIKGIYVVMALLTILALVFGLSYAQDYLQAQNELIANIVKIDEEAFGDASFNSEYYELLPILDESVDENNQNVIKIGFIVGGAQENDADNVIYDISLAGLKIDCELLSPYLKWRLYKNDEVLSEGSFDYKFDTITSGRLVLTEIQQDLKPYNVDKTTYDQYELYIWLSDSCQENDLLSCLESDAQNNLTGRNISGRINVELRTGRKVELVRTPNDVLNETSCIKGMEA